MRPPLLVLSEQDKPGSGPKGALFASRGQSLLENPSSPISPSRCKAIQDSQVGRRLQEFHLQGKISFKLALRCEAHLKQALAFDCDGGAWKGACDLYV